MSDTTPITAEQAQAMRQQLALYERREAYKSAMLSNAIYAAIKPIVDSPEFIALHEQLVAIRASKPENEHYFGLGLDAICNGMLSLGTSCANWSTPVDPDAPLAPAPTPSTEGNTDGE
jgi:hypothetical protein